MKINIEVKDEKEALAIKRALKDAETRALVLTMGYLLGLQSDRSRVRVLEGIKAQ